MTGSCALIVTLVVSMASSLWASPQDLWQRFQQQERARQAARALDVGPYTGLMLDQYYPLWSQASVLELDEPTSRLIEPDDRMVDEDYGYELTPEMDYGIESDKVATGVEEQIYKDLLLRYLLREMDKQDALPVVRRRSEYRPRSAPRLSAPKAQPRTSTTTATPPTTTTTVKAAAVSEVQSQQQGQKEVALLRPPTDHRHRPLSWPQELESTQTQQATEKKEESKRMPETAALPTAPKKHPKEAFDILTAQLNSLRSRSH